ncbi:MAG: CehA/McbA family metallohydrolase [Pirellulaceae bacterium]
MDETGQSTPALLRLTAQPSGRLWEPAGACDLRALLNDVAPIVAIGPGLAYPVRHPGSLHGPYWVVPKAFEMAVPAGQWDVQLIRGPEYVPVRETLTVEPGVWTRKTLQFSRWTNMPVLGWYSGDDHVHARLMSSDDADKLMAFTRAADIHVSNILEMGDPMRTYYAQRGFGPEFRVQFADHWLVPGQEDPRSLIGHAIGLNLRHKVRDLSRYYLNDWIADEIHQQGGLYGHTHVGENACLVHREMALFTPLDIVDFNSIMQIRLGTELFYDFLNLGFKMTASAGSDTPCGGTVGVVRLYAYAGTTQPFSPDSWFEGV